MITPAGSRLVGRHSLRSIFVNYRRNDSEGEAGRLFDDLTSRFSPEGVFMDVVGIEPGRDFRKVIDQSVATCSVLLAIIGQEWLEVKDTAGNRRLDDSNDLVRIELASALRRDITVIPVLVRGATMPRSEQLPDELKDLAYRNAVELSHAHWKTDVQVLLQALRPYMDAPQAPVAVVDQSKQTDRPGIPEIFHSAPAVMGITAGAHIVEGRMLDHISRELAIYIGPIADVIVRQAVKHCSSFDELCSKVASEIDDEPNRAKFLRACRS